MSKCFSYGILEQDTNSAKIVVYICRKNDFDRLHKSLIEYCEKYMISHLLIRDGHSTHWSSMEKYFEEKKKENRDFLDKSFDRACVYDPPWSEFLPVHQKI